MTESTIKASSGEANGPPVAAERITNAPRPKSPLSGGSDNDGSEKPIRERLKKASIAGLSTHGKENEDKGNADDTSAESSAGEEEEIGDEDVMLTDTKSPLRGRPTRKRSFDDLQNESMTSIDASAHDAATRAGGHHKRMRSKDMSSSRTAAVNGKAEREQVEALAEEEDDVDARKSPGGAGVMVEPPSMDDNAATSGDQSPKKKRSRDQFDKDHTPEGDPLDKEEHHTVLSQRQPHETEDEAKIANGDKGEPDKKRHRDTSQEAREAADTEQMTETVRT
jgi:Ran-binding protein 3